MTLESYKSVQVLGRAKPLQKSLLQANRDTALQLPRRLQMAELQADNPSIDPELER